MALLFHCEVVPLSQVPKSDQHPKNGKPFVLVVDDEPLVAETLSLILSSAGFDTKAVHNGNAALKLAQSVQPAFLLTDVHMPGMSGVELALTFRVAFPDCKVLLFSGTPTAQDMAPALEAGVEFPLLQKPIHPTEIIEYVWKSLAEFSSNGFREAIERTSAFAV